MRTSLCWSQESQVSSFSVAAQRARIQSFLLITSIGASSLFDIQNKKTIRSHYNMDCFFLVGAGKTENTKKVISYFASVGAVCLITASKTSVSITGSGRISWTCPKGGYWWEENHSWGSNRANESCVGGLRQCKNCSKQQLLSVREVHSHPL